MCDAGRIRHHLRNWLWNARATVLLVGFQAQGTLGRFLADGAKAVRIQGNEIKVAARIRISTTIPDMPTDRNWRAGSQRAAQLSAACSWFMARSRPSPASRNVSPNGHPGGASFPAASGRRLRIVTAQRRRCSMAPVAAGWRPRPWSGSTGTMTCRNSFSTSTIASKPPQTIARAESSFEGYSVHWMNESTQSRST